MKKPLSYVITKKIAKHGSQAVIVIPTILNQKLKPQMLVKVTIDVLEADIFDELNIGNEK
jgi:antitoxin component of MazEF toxin-antitoxin module